MTQDKAPIEAKDTVMTLLQLHDKPKGQSYLEAQVEVSFSAGIEKGRQMERERIYEELKPLITQCKCNGSGSDWSLESHQLKRLFRFWQALKGEANG